MPKREVTEYTVQITTSVVVESDTIQGAVDQAVAWAQESLSDSNAEVRVYEPGQYPLACYIQPL